MNEKSDDSFDEILKEIDQAAERMKHAKSINDKVGYDIALQEYERIYKEYSDTLYKNRDPPKVYVKRF